MDNKIDAHLHHILEHYSEGSKAAYNDHEMWEGWTVDAITKIKQLFKEEWLRMIGEDKPELSVGNGFEGGFEAAYRVKVQNQLRAELRRKLVEGEK